MCRSISVGSGITATDAVDVWTRPLDSVLGTLCTRWTPLSNFSLAKAPLPITRVITSLKPSCDVPVSATAAEMDSNRQPFARPALRQEDRSAQHERNEASAGAHIARA